MEQDQSDGPAGLPYTGKTNQQGHPWEQAEQYPASVPALPATDAPATETEQPEPVTEQPEPESPVQGPVVRGLPGLELPAQEPTAQGPAVQGPTVQGPVAQGPVVQGPAVQGPVVQGPVVQGPAGQELTAPIPVVGGEPPRRPPGEDGSLRGSSWEQRGQQGISLARLVDVEWRKLVATTAERVLLAVALVVLPVATWLAGTLVNQGGPDAAAYQIFGLVLACQLAPMPLYAAVLRSLSAEWYYRSVELTLLYQPSKLRNAAAQLLVVLPLWPVIAVAQFGIYFLAQPTLAPLWTLAVALLGGLLTMLFALTIGLLIRNPNAAALIYLVLSIGYIVRVRNPLVLRWFDPWQPASLLANSVRETLPSVSSAGLLVVALAIGLVVAARR